MPLCTPFGYITGRHHVSITFYIVKFELHKQHCNDKLLKSLAREKANLSGIGSGQEWASLEASVELFE